MAFYLSVIALTFVVTSFAYIARLWLVRTVWSPLAPIPGPRFAALTYLYEIYYDCVRPAKYVFRIQQMHEECGPVVRINPDHISVSDLDQLDLIYDPPGGRRDKYRPNHKTLGDDKSLGGAWQHDLHKIRRRALNKFFSQRAILETEDMLQEKLGRLRRHFEEAQTSGNVLNLSDLNFAFANDVVRTYAFGHDENALGNPRRAKEMRRNVNSVLTSAKLNLHFPWIKALTAWLPSNMRAVFTPHGTADMIKFRLAIRHGVSQMLLGDKREQLSRYDNTIFRELRGSPLLPPEEKTAARLEDEAILVVMAGTESTAKSITIAQYYLAAIPEVLAKLREELQHHQPGISVTELQKLPYLNGIIVESHRLSFGLTGRNARVSPDTTIALTTASKRNSKSITYQIPPGTPVSISTLQAHTDPTLFPNPWAFDPTRWIRTEQNSVDVERRRKCMIAFSKGPRTCVGMNLANAEMALCIAEMSRWNVQLWGTDEEDVKFLHDYHVSNPKLSSQGVRCKVVGIHRPVMK